MTRRKAPSHLATAKGTAMKLTLFVTGVCEFLEGVDRGESALDAADKAYSRTKVRKRAIQKAAKEALPELERIDRGE